MLNRKRITLVIIYILMAFMVGYYIITPWEMVHVYKIPLAALKSGEEATQDFTYITYANPVFQLFALHAMVFAALLALTLCIAQFGKRQWLDWVLIYGCFAFFPIGTCIGIYVCKPERDDAVSP
jgi:hypothetical protein